MASTAVNQSVREAIGAANRAFEVAYSQGNAASAATVYSSDAKAFPPNSPTVSGGEALHNFWQAVMDMGVKGVKLETVELEPSGDHIIEVGRATLTGEGGAVLDIAKFIVVWKQENGQWKWYRDIWNSERPA